MADSDRATQLAYIISHNTSIISTHLSTNGLAPLSFSPSQPLSLLQDEKITSSRLAILEATDELHALLLGPLGILTSLVQHMIPVGVQAIYRFNLATSFPPGKDEATFEEIAEISGLEVGMVKRILRAAIPHKIFHEPRKGIVAHTAASQILAQEANRRDYVGMITEEMWPSGVKTVDAIAKWPGSQEPNHSGFNIAHRTDDTVFEHLARHPSRWLRYANTMKIRMADPGLETAHTVENYAWESIGPGTVVDVGGNDGAVSIALLRRFHTLRCIVQDQAEIAAQARANAPPDLAQRLSFMAHDFFSPQPVKGADVYYFRWIMHDWSDKYAIRILRALIPALKRGAKIVINDLILPEPGTVSSYQQKLDRNADIAMLEFHNAKERDGDDWKMLFHEADPRFTVLNLKQPPASTLGIVEVGWDGESSS